MGLWDSLRGPRIKDPVDLTARVVSVTEAPHATHGTAVMNLVVQPPGSEAVPIECTATFVPVAKWPSPGGELPVTVDRSDPTKCKVRWDDVADAGENARLEAESLAAQMNQGAASASGVSRGDLAAILGQSAGDVDGMIAALKQSYPDAEITVEGGGYQAQPQGNAGADRVEQLERLSRLRESGALTDAEFEREKARILSEG